MLHEDRRPSSLLDLAQSCLRMSWAISVLGASEAVRLLAGRPRAERAGAGFEAVRDAAESEMDENARGIFRAGDQIQRGMVETFSELARQPLLDPRRAARAAFEAGGRWLGADGRQEVPGRRGGEEPVRTAGAAPQSPEPGETE
jgi:hypothetical protein